MRMDARDDRRGTSFVSSTRPKLRLAVSSGIGRVSDRPANWRIEATSYTASSIAGSGSANPLCLRWIRRIVADG